jgi:hypothetical protein
MLQPNHNRLICTVLKKRIKVINSRIFELESEVLSGSEDWVCALDNILLLDEKKERILNYLNK